MAATSADAEETIGTSVEEGSMEEGGVLEDVVVSCSEVFSILWGGSVFGVLRLEPKKSVNGETEEGRGDSVDV